MEVGRNYVTPPIGSFEYGTVYFGVFYKEYNKQSVKYFYIEIGGFSD